MKSLRICASSIDKSASMSFGFIGKELIILVTSFIDAAFPLRAFVISLLIKLAV